MAGVLSNLYYSAQDAKDLADAYRREGEKGLQSVIQSKSKQFANVQFRIAVMGESGAGKSTLINALLGLDEAEGGAATTGYQETSTVITPYSHPTLRNVRYYDFPGLNTPRFPVKKFMKETNFSQCDLAIIVTGSRFTENDQLLAKALEKAGKPFYLVRSKIDDTVRAESRKKGYNQEEMFLRMREQCISSLKAAGIQEPRVFFYSAFDLDKYDFPKLKETMVSNLSEVQRNLFLVSLPNTSEAAIDSKRDALRHFIQSVAIASGVIGAVPVPGLSLACDLALIGSGILFIRKELGLDDRSLDKLAQTVGTSVTVLRKDTKQEWVFGEITREQVILLLQRSTAALALTAAEPFLDFVPILGSFFGATTSFGVTLVMLTNSLDVMMETAKIVLKNAKAAASEAPGNVAGYRGP
ncbi:interferon-inducible GTPase 5-like [Pristis pectinata]|uniref:interferon-inducible GTPase 5-like n=1 Tax=Pristis pectinata TaxID=685728 RepID=UPI00223CC7B6|nr:interferon-inducible GTPase 5-like [Pristis pectinata]XP_051868674.1 interferon-inducible GTPase 5-like [Pristis pectinata]XP_051868675.1 interferon-inducible GTPase 5-like [Pristis pectinata]XP_051868676.1 interferon-inducible GTPase 5-like [Pristis pectinata]XP_051868677.1 interferon-inducible GTPase 5-like [Pristis pectinata]XP_051868679.1 interferon-inducible GTPase 5-like [Pristis pectinata]XP_051868680.1 interferon-inducible GTPase 5-like [Pristis pectinata]XP_051868681.1 interferon